MSRADNNPKNHVIVYGDIGNGQTGRCIVDPITNAFIKIDHTHNEVHEGHHFHLSYAVADLGVMTTPDDTITLTFFTPNTTSWLHMIFSCKGSSGSRFMIIEGGTGGGASPTGELTVFNNDRNSSATSAILATSGGNAGKVSYDATAVTGGTTLHDEYIGAEGFKSISGETTRSEQEWVLKQNTQYQISLINTSNVPGTLTLSWYEHTNL